MHRHLISCLLVLSFLIIGVQTATAFEYDVAATLQSVDNDFEAGVINLDQKARLMAYALFATDKLPDSYYRTSQDLNAVAGQPPRWFRGGTMAVETLRRMLPDLSPAVRAEVEKYFLTTPRPVKSGPKLKDDYPEGFYTSNVEYSEHFAIRYGNNWGGSIDTINTWLDILEDEVWATEIEAWGYQPIAQSDTYYIDIYIGNSGDQAPDIDFAGAYTTIYYDQDYGMMPYMVFHPMILDYLSSIRDVSSHEFYHCTQFTHVIVDGCWYYMGETETWFVEATAVWAEGTVYPDIKNWIGYISDWASSPQEPLTNNTYGGYGPYARGIYARYLYEHVDGLNTIYDIWNDCSASTLFGVFRYLQEQQIDWVEHYIDFMARLAVLDFVDGSLLPKFTTVKTVSTFPLKQSSAPSTRKPYLNGINIYEITNGSESDPRLNIQFIGGETGDSRIRWGAGVLKVKSNGDSDLEMMVLSGAGTGELTVDGLGTTYNKMYLLISPTTGQVINENKRIDYKLQLTRGDDGFDDFTDDDDDDDDDDDNDDDDDDDDDDCDSFCDRVESCGMIDFFGFSSMDECLSGCDSLGAEYLDCALNSSGCDEFAECFGAGDDDDDDDDDDDGCGC